MANILKTIIHGLVTSIGLRVISMGLRFVTICLLPFWMSPWDIGLMALILACVNLPVALADFGFGTSIIKEKQTSERMYRSVFTFVMISSALIAAAIIIGSSWIESAFALPAGLAILAAFALPFNGAAIVPNAILQKDLRFTNLAVRDLIGEVTFSGVSLVLAIQGYGALSIAIAVVAQRLIRWTVASVSVQWKPVLCLNRDDLRQLSHFSFFQFLSLSLAQIFNQIDKLLLAAFLSPAALGIYSQAQQFTVYPVQSLSGTANNVFFASFSKVQDDLETLRTLMTKILKGLILICGVIVAFLAPAMHLIPLIYNEEWVNVVPVAIILCAFLPAFCAFIFEGIMIAIGGEQRRVVSGVIKLVLLVAGTVGVFCMFPGINGPCAMAVVFGCSTLIAAINNLCFILKRLEIRSVRPFAGAIALALVLAGAGMSLSISLWY